jgi:hypothetical protein
MGHPWTLKLSIQPNGSRFSESVGHPPEQTQRDCYNARISPPENFATWGKKPTASGKRATISAYSEFKATEYGRSKRVVANEEVKSAIRNIGINRCARESGFDRKNFIRKLVRGIPVKRNSYEEFVRWLGGYPD